MPYHRGKYDIEVPISLEDQLDFIRDRAVFIDEDSTLTCEAQVEGEPENGGYRTQVDLIDSQLNFVDSNCNEVKLSDDEYDKAEKFAFDRLVDYAHEIAWEQRYE